MLMAVAATRSLSSSGAGFRGAFAGAAGSTGAVGGSNSGAAADCNSGVGCISGGGCNSEAGGSAIAVAVGAASAVLPFTRPTAFTLAVLLLAFLLGLGINQYIWILNCYNG